MIRQGINAFLFDCISSDALACVEVLYGAKGFAIIVKIMCKIHYENGYYCEWNERTPLLLLSKWFCGDSGVSVGLIKEVVNAAINEGVFDKRLYEKYQILTSEAIQDKYFDGIKKRTKIKLIEQYLLLSAPQNTEIVSLFSKKGTENQEKGTENQTIEKKENKINKKELNNKDNTGTDKPPRARTVFKKPTVEEIFEYCRERGSTVDPERFYDYYESNGWKAGRNPMKDWKAAVRNWERNGYDVKRINNASAPKAASNPYFDLLREMDAGQGKDGDDFDG